MSRTQDDLRLLVRDTLTTSGIKQAWIAGQLGLSEKHLSGLLIGRSDLTLDWAERILALCERRLILTVVTSTGPEREQVHASIAEQATTPTPGKKVRRTRATLAVLTVLDEHDRIWGYEITRLTGLAGGAVYPILTRLHTHGWIAVSQEPSPHAGRPARHYYQLTEYGQTQARTVLGPKENQCTT